MNIAAVMAALDVWDLDHNAKMALLVVACRADRNTGKVQLSISRVAADMKVGYYAASHGLDRAVESGYLTVDKIRRRTPTWQLTTAVATAVLDENRGSSTAVRPRTKDLDSKEKEGAAASLARRANGGAVDNPPPRRTDFAPGSGRLPDFTGVGRLHVVGDGPDQR